MPSFSKIGFFLAVVIAVLLASPTALWSQNVYGTIAGTVTDSSGAAVADTAVTLTNLDTGEARTSQTSTTGSYTFVNVLPARYKLEGVKAGFKKFVRQPIVVEIESGLRVDFALEVGELTQTVEVTSAAPITPAGNSFTRTGGGNTHGNGSTAQRPQSTGDGRLSRRRCSPRAASAGNSSMGNPVGANPFAAGDFQIGGGQAGQSQILIDGVPTNGAYLNVVTVIPTQDAIQEFKVQTNNLGPEYGRFAGGVINLSTKSGTNAFHGSAYDFCAINC